MLGIAVWEGSTKRGTTLQRKSHLFSNVRRYKGLEIASREDNYNYHQTCLEGTGVLTTYTISHQRSKAHSKHQYHHVSLLTQRTKEGVYSRYVEGILRKDVSIEQVNSGTMCLYATTKLHDDLNHEAKSNRPWPNLILNPLSLKYNRRKGLFTRGTMPCKRRHELRIKKRDTTIASHLIYTKVGLLRLCVLHDKGRLTYNQQLAIIKYLINSNKGN